MFFSILFLLSSLVYADPCKVLKTTDIDTTLPNFIVNSGATGVITVVSAPPLPSEIRDPVERLLTDEDMTLAKASPTTSKVLAYYHEALADQAALLTYLHDKMTKVQLGTLVLDQPAETLNEFERVGNKLYLNAFQMQMAAHSGDVSLDRLILIAVGAPIYAKLVDPTSFRLTKIEGMTFPKNPPPVAETPISEKHVTRKKAKVADSSISETAYIRARDKLHGQASSLQTLAHLRKRIRQGEFHDKSLASVKEKVLREFWKPARHAVDDYLDAEFSRGTSKAHFKDAYDEVDDANAAPAPAENETLIDHLLQKVDRTLVFANPEHFDLLKKQFLATCR